jgi:mycofactocin precursor
VVKDAANVPDMENPVATDAAPAVDDVVSAPLSTDDLIADELLVEEISIDGMCGVY